MIVDCHTHIDFEKDDIGVSGHLEAAEPVDVCIVLAGAGGSSDEVNKKLSEYVNKHKTKMIGFGLVEPTRDEIGVKKLSSKFGKLGLKGAVVYCADSGFHPTHSRAMRFYESAAELGLPIFFHNGAPLGHKAVLNFAQPMLLDEVARAFGNLKIVIGSMGMPFLEQTLAMVAKHENVYADLTIKPSSIWRVYNTVVAAYEREVMDKLLFGSGYPMSTAGECMETLLGFNKLLADTNLPTVRRGLIQNIVERDTLAILGIEKGA